MSRFAERLLSFWYSPRPFWPFIPLSLLFAVLSAVRRAGFRFGILPIATLPAPVVVVGNITVGGTGKTPFVIWLAQALKERGYKPGIITRGYGGSSSNWPLLVIVSSDTSEAGDEAVLLAGRAAVPVVAGPDRVAAARLLLETSPVDVVLSDDGLQHYRLPRVLEIMLLDGERGLGNGWLLPTGPLREPEGRLQDADLVIIKKTPAGRFSWPDALSMELGVDAAVALSDGRHVSLKDFSGQAVHAVAGIGNPGQFFSVLRAAGLKVDGRALPDHTVLTPADLVFPDAAPVFMTEKDSVKCRGMRLDNHWCVPVSARFTSSDAARILDVVQKRLADANVTPASGK